MRTISGQTKGILIVSKQNIDLINQGTNDPVVARNWHFHKVPETARALISDLENMHDQYSSQDDKDKLNLEISSLKDKLETFLNKYPAPTKVKIIDSVEICDIQPAWQRLLPLHYRPNEPLTLLSEPEGNRYIYYRKTNNEVIKVVNSLINRPNQREAIDYSY